MTVIDAEVTHWNLEVLNMYTSDDSKTNSGVKSCRTKG